MYWGTDEEFCVFHNTDFEEPWPLLCPTQTYDEAVCGDDVEGYIEYSYGNNFQIDDTIADRGSTRNNLPSPAGKGNTIYVRNKGRLVPGTAILYN